jgi:hypothetical protein
MVLVISSSPKKIENEKSFRFQSLWQWRTKRQANQVERQKSDHHVVRHVVRLSRHHLHFFVFLFLFEYFFVRFLCSLCSVGDFFDRREEKPDERWRMMMVVVMPVFLFGARGRKAKLMFNHRDRSQDEIFEL